MIGHICEITYSFVWTQHKKSGLLSLFINFIVFTVYFGVLCDSRVPQKLKGKFYRTAIRPAMLYGAECWPTKRRHVQQLSVAEMRMLRWFCGHTRRDRVRNEAIRE